MAARPRPVPAPSALPGLLAVLFAVPVVVAVAAAAPAKPRVYLSSWAVRVAAGPRDAQALARRHGLLYLGQVMEGEPYYHLGHRGTRQRALSRHWGWHVRLMRDPEVLWFEQQTLKRRTKRGASVVPTDPWFPKQWYMNNDISPDLNILTAWSRGYTGRGVVLTILDDGLEKDHPDLAANYDPQASYDFNSNDPDPQPRYGDGDNNWHGTRCAGEVAAVANNGICGAGVAYNAKIGGVRMLDGPIIDVVEAQALSLHSQHIHIYSASWGPEDDGRTVDGPGELAAAAFHRGVSQGRGGLGSIFIWASGNGGIHYDDCNCDGYGNSIYTVSVGSVLGDGQRPRYSEGCAAILTTTYSSRASSDVQIVTTDLHHRCTDKHTGTSASAPLAAGMVALALEAKASKPAHLKAEDWAKNGVGRRVSHYYGYGLLDAGLLVQEAMAWAGTRPQEKCSVKVLQAPRDIGSKLTISTDVFSCSQSIRSLEHVQVQLSLSYSRRGDLVVALSSPTGTTSMLVTMRPYDTSQEGYKDWTFMSTHFWDENPKGTWTLHLENKGDAHNTGQLTSFILHLHGTDEDMSSRRSAASATDGCVRWDKEGACEECGSSLYAHQRSCLPYCPPRYYGRARGATATARVCAHCHPSCYTCQGASATNCTSCPSTRTFQQLTHTCSPSQGPLSPGGLRRELLVVTVLACSSLVLAGILYPTCRVALRAGKGAFCCPRAGRTE
ncbi:proprotein convertase subtilisin/kexin type 4 isoform X2 [Pipra filicauda]|uniref:Proprotein convertase subtilisin/kexin type 4 isoform X2 n=1 Tax=Pipra filicauda TaxID=649802 RepID=A0A6J2HG41_9PASS|nr:proprotein convertase subtilisin/kexin type 4 isoform X2 [Pipra filicauda]